MSEHLLRERRLLSFADADGANVQKFHPKAETLHEATDDWSKLGVGLEEKAKRFDDVVRRCARISDDASHRMLQESTETLKKVLGKRLKDADVEFEKTLDKHIEHFRQYVLPIEKEKGRQVYHLYVPNELSQPQLFVRSARGQVIGPMIVGRMSMDPSTQEEIGVLKVADDRAAGHYVFEQSPDYRGSFWVVGRRGRTEKLSDARVRAADGERKKRTEKQEEEQKEKREDQKEKQRDGSREVAIEQDGDAWTITFPPGQAPAVFYDPEHLRVHSDDPALRLRGNIAASTYDAVGRLEWIRGERNRCIFVKSPRYAGKLWIESGGRRIELGVKQQKEQRERERRAEAAETDARMRTLPPLEVAKEFKVESDAREIEDNVRLVAVLTQRITEEKHTLEGAAANAYPESFPAWQNTRLAQLQACEATLNALSQTLAPKQEILDRWKVAWEAQKKLTETQAATDALWRDLESKRNVSKLDVTSVQSLLASLKVFSQRVSAERTKWDLLKVTTDLPEHMRALGAEREARLAVLVSWEQAVSDLRALALLREKDLRRKQLTAEKSREVNLRKNETERQMSRLNSLPPKRAEVSVVLAKVRDAVTAERALLQEIENAEVGIYEPSLTEIARDRLTLIAEHEKRLVLKEMDPQQLLVEYKETKQAKEGIDQGADVTESGISNGAIVKNFERVVKEAQDRFDGMLYKEGEKEGYSVYIIRNEAIVWGNLFYENFKGVEQWVVKDRKWQWTEALYSDSQNKSSRRLCWPVMVLEDVSPDGRRGGWLREIGEVCKQSEPRTLTEFVTRKYRYLEKYANPNAKEKRGLSKEQYDEYFGGELYQGHVGNCGYIAALKALQLSDHCEEIIRTSVRVEDGIFSIGIPMGAAAKREISVSQNELKPQVYDGRVYSSPSGHDGWRALEVAYAKSIAEEKGQYDKQLVEGGFGQKKIDEKLKEIKKLLGEDGKKNAMKIKELEVDIDFVKRDIREAPIKLRDRKAGGGWLRYDTRGAEIEGAFGKLLAGVSNGLVGGEHKPGDGVSSIAERGIQTETIDWLGREYSSSKYIATATSSSLSFDKIYDKYTIFGRTFFGCHGYTIRGVDVANGKVTVLNPHNTSVPIVLTFAQFCDVFSSVQYVKIDYRNMFTQ